ncbi:PREDICTED: solute carrier family 22 member 6-B-like [Nanorana parkeri]|uniref:solute carrier family 22 member 6-B-like n=1 Tax=Nanorana parkeri TaxID=125878 RepID=UPI0008544953|nr:PREDICTED: solute carrier family 22 member 6-B-like [Nanorana parkeri]
MALKDVLEKERLFSPFHSILVSVLSAPLLFVATHNLMQIFTAAVPPHHCQSNLTWEQFSQPNDSCNRYISSLSNATEPCKPGDWKYDLSTYTSTIISKWDLVCEREWMKELAQSVYMSGVLVGAIVYGSLADRFGRRVVILWCLLQTASMGTGAAFAPYFSLYCFFRFMTGMGICGFIINDLGLTMEWTPMRYRPTVSIFQGTCLTIGQIILAGVAYVIRDWNWLQLALSVPYFFFFILTCWVPESSRWLVLANRSQQALYNLNRVARVNGDKHRSPVTLEMLRPETQNDSTALTSRMTPIDLFRTPTMRKMTIFLSMSWFSSSFCFFALAMDIQKFGLSIYLVQVVFGCVELPLRVLSTVISAYIGRRFAVSVFLILPGILILCSLAVPKDLIILQLSLTVLSKGFLGSSIVCAYLYTAEVFPTVLRQTGLGFTNMMMRLGAVVAPLVMMTKAYVPFLPLVIFGAVPIVCGLPILWLPETLDCPLLDTVDEVEARGKNATCKTKEKESVFGTKL